jgi:DNA polymerase
MQAKELEKLNKIIASCKKCPLHKTRTNAVPGEGPANAKIMFIGESPGRTEDIQGRPFVGLAGKFLNKLFNSIDLKRTKVFITGSVKCRPPKNRVPTEEEIQACKPYLEKQIEIIKPKLIVILGNVALKTLLGEKSVSNLHGKIFEKKGIKYFITFHPAAAMRFPKIRKKMEKDFKKLRKLILYL